MARKYVTCPKCGHRSDRAGGRRKCQGCAAPLPKRRVPKHAETLRDQGYAEYALLNGEIHGSIGLRADGSLTPAQQRHMAEMYVDPQADPPMVWTVRRAGREFKTAEALVAKGLLQRLDWSFNYPAYVLTTDGRYVARRLAGV